MPKLCALILLLALACPGIALAAKKKAPPAPAEPPNPATVEGKGIILYDASQGVVLFERNATSPFLPASTTKLMTALLVYEATHLDGSVIVEKADTEVEPSSIPLKIGETVPIRTLVRALLIGSDNDAAMALGRSCAGDVNRFVDKMNTRAAQLGCKSTRFRNPNGLPMANQYTTARDLLLIFQKVLMVPELRLICRTPSFYLSTQAGVQLVKNHNKLLGQYPGMGPAKTGWTVASRHTYAASAIRDGRELQLIILNSPNKWRDAQILFDYGFSIPVLSSQKPVASVAKP